MDAGLARFQSRGFLSSVARRAGEGRAQSRQVRSRVRPCLQGARAHRRCLLAEIPEEWLRRLTEKFLTEEEKKLIQSLGGWEKIMEELQEAPRRAEGPPPGRQQMDRHRRHLALRRLWLQSRRRAHRPGREPQQPRHQGVGPPRLQGSRRHGRTRHPQHQAGAPAACANSPARARPKSLISTARSARPPTRAISICSLVPERRNTVKVLLFFDVGGSMDPLHPRYARNCSRRRAPSSSIWSISTSTIAFTRRCGRATAAAMTSRWRPGACCTPIRPTTR